MLKDVIQYEFLFASQNVDNKDILTIPLKITCHTPDLKIEQHCKMTYPELLISKAFSMEELKLKLKMTYDIKKMWKYNEDIFEFLKNTWFKFLNFKNKIIDFEIYDANCKWWNDKDNPHLELTINVKCNIKLLMDIYIKNKYFWVVNNKSSILQETYNVKFIKPIPLMLTYIQSGAIQGSLNKYIKNMLNDKNCLINKEIENKYKIKDFEKYKKDYVWISTDQIKITINDFWKMIKKRVGEHKVATAAGLYYTYKALKNKHER